MRGALGDGSGVQGSGFKIWALGFRAQGIWFLFRVLGFRKKSSKRALSEPCKELLEELCTGPPAPSSRVGNL